jgi:hypothetical protein
MSRNNLMAILAAMMSMASMQDSVKQERKENQRAEQKKKLDTIIRPAGMQPFCELNGEVVQVSLANEKIIRGTGFKSKKTQKVLNSIGAVNNNKLIIPAGAKHLVWALNLKNAERKINKLKNNI